MKDTIKYSDIKYLLKYTANQKYPAKANIVFLRNKDMSVTKYENYKSKEQYKKELKNYLYRMLKSYDRYETECIEHWKI